MIIDDRNRRSADQLDADWCIHSAKGEPTMNAHGRLSNWLRSLALLPAAALFAGPAGADIDLRVQSRPIADPIEAFIRVTDGSGPLTIADFAATLDGAALNTFTFGLPPNQDPAQHMSIVFVIDYGRIVQGSAGSAIRDAVTAFINQMNVGDYAAVVKFRLEVLDPGFLPDVQPFTFIDLGANSTTLIDFVAVPYAPNRGLTSVFGGVILGVDQFVTPPAALPNGPKAIIMIDDGIDNASSESQSDAMAYANANGIPIFTIGVGDVALFPHSTAQMTALASDTGGIYVAAPQITEIADALATVTSFLRDSYKLTFPQNAVTDCDLHMLEVSAQGQPANIAFARCDTTPDNFSFGDGLTVPPGTTVESDAATITGIESPVAVTVVGGEYAIGCGSTRTSAPGIILSGEEVCVWHTASANFSATTETELIVGGVSSPFILTTVAAPPPPPPPPPSTGGGYGGGGSTGVIELLLALGALFGRRRHLR